MNRSTTHHPARRKRHRDLPTVGLLLGVLLLASGNLRAGSLDEQLCLAGDDRSCLPPEPAAYLDATRDWRLHFSAEQLLRQSCLSYHHARQRAAADRLLRSSAGRWTDADESLWRERDAAHAGSAGAYCELLAAFSTELQHRMPSALAATAGDDRLRLAAAYWASLLRSALPAGTAHEASSGPSGVPAMQAVDVVLDGDIVAYVDCWLDAPDQAACRDQRLLRIGQTAAVLNNRALGEFDAALAGSLRLVLHALPDDRSRARLIRHAAPILLVVADHTKFRPAHSRRSRGESWQELVAGKRELLEEDDSPLGRELCLYSVGAGHLACYTDLLPITGGRLATIESLLDEGSIGSGGCSFDEMIRHGVHPAIEGAFCKRDACRGDGEGGAADALRERIASALGAERHAAFCDQGTGGGGAEPDRFDPVGVLDCTMGRTGFDPGRCVDTIGDQGAHPDRPDFGSDLDLVGASCVTPVSYTEADVDRVEDDVQAAIEALLHGDDLDTDLELIAGWLDENGDWFDGKRFRLGAGEVAEEMLSFSVETRDLSDDGEREMFRDACQGGWPEQGKSEEECIDYMANHVGGFYDYEEQTIVVNTNYHAARELGLQGVVDTIKHELVHAILDQLGMADGDRDHEAICDAWGDTATCNQTTDEWKNYDDPAGDQGGSDQFCLPGIGECVDGCNARGQAASDQFEACFGGDDVPEADPLAPYVLRDPLTWDGSGLMCMSGGAHDLDALENLCRTTMLCADQTRASANPGGVGTCSCSPSYADPGLLQFEAHAQAIRCDARIRCGAHSQLTSLDGGCACGAAPPAEMVPGEVTLPIQPDTLNTDPAIRDRQQVVRRMIGEMNGAR